LWGARRVCEGGWGINSILPMPPPFAPLTVPPPLCMWWISWRKGAVKQPMQLSIAAVR